MTEKISTINVYRGYLIPDVQAPRTVSYSHLTLPTNREV